MPFIRSISGLRATLGDGLSPVLLAEYAAAFAHYCASGPIVLGRDGRPSGIWIEEVISGTLSACGRHVIRLGIVPTPTVQLMTEHSEAAGGIAVTASHNPSEWNGLKFLNSDGIFLDAAENEEFWRIVDGKQFEFDPSQNLPGISYPDSLTRHIDRVLNLRYLGEAAKRKLADRKFKVVVDAVNASGSVIVPRLLEKLGCEVIPLFCDASGVFPHRPEPLPANLSELADTVKRSGADMGVAVDPDADRLVLIDNEGVPVSEEKTIVLASLAVLDTCGKGDVFVINHSTSMMLEKIASVHGVDVLRSPVGEINVVKKMKETGAVFGGEGSGGVILPECHFGRDSLVGIALVLTGLADSAKSLAELSASLPDLKMIKFKKDFSGDFASLKMKLMKSFTDASIIDEDGLKFDFGDSWVQVRASNTEPIIRIIAEAFTEEKAAGLIEEVRSRV